MNSFFFYGVLNFLIVSVLVGLFAAHLRGVAGKGVGARAVAYNHGKLEVSYNCVGGVARRGIARDGDIYAKLEVVKVYDFDILGKRFDYELGKPLDIQVEHVLYEHHDAILLFDGDLYAPRKHLIEAGADFFCRLKYWFSPSVLRMDSYSFMST